MRIATWNVNGLRARLDFFLAWLRERQPDVVAVQELKLEDEQFPRDELASLGYGAVVHGQKAWNGVAVVARGDVRALRSGLPGQEEHGARLVTAELPGLVFTSVYVPNGKSVDHADFPGKLAWLDALAAHLAATVRPGDAAVVAGDFNVVPAPIDGWNEARFAGQVFHTDAERARFRSLADAGFHDLFREAHPDAAEFSWWDYRGGAFHRKQGLRIDFLLGTDAVRRRLRKVEIDREWRKKHEGLIPSDHAPVVAELGEATG
jgi:exodeoxyribonuclease III